MCQTSVHTENQETLDNAFWGSIGYADYFRFQLYNDTGSITLNVITKQFDLQETKSEKNHLLILFFINLKYTECLSIVPICAHVHP